jgi:PAS domain S-box-containing protein
MEVRGTGGGVVKGFDAETWLAALVSSSHDAIIGIVGEDQTIASWNQGAERLYGWKQDEVIGRSISVIIPPDRRGEQREIFARLAAGEAITDMEVLAQRKDGSLVHVSLSISAVRDGGGAIIGAASIARDLTERKRLVEQVLLADRLASVGTLAGGIAHELNNPLASVIGNLDYVVGELTHLAGDVRFEELHEVDEALADAQTAADRMRKVIASLKTFAAGSRDTEKLAVLEIPKVIDLAVSLSYNEIRHRGELTRDIREVPTVRADEARLAQVFINLLVNATQALPLGRSEEHVIKIATRTGASGTAIVEVSDDGPGMPPEVARRIFDPFFSTREGSMGLGLSLCHGIVTNLGGTIRVDTAPGKGTRFTVELPPADARPRAQPQPSEKPARLGGRVLLIDDDVGFARALARRLGQTHDVTVETSGQAALERLAHGEQFDAILCDVMMPNTTGLEVFAQLLGRDPPAAARLVFMTGGAFTPEARRFLETVPNPRVEKPFDVSTVTTLIAQLMSRG